MIRPYQPRDLAAITAIYNHYVENEIATFEETALSEQQMRERLEGIAEAFPVLVLEGEQSDCIGYAYGTHFKPRSAYRFTAETTIYLAPGCQQRGAGTRLYQALLDALAAQGIREVLGVLTQPNPASEALHRKLGYQHQGTLHAVGFKFGRWLDVAFWQKSLIARNA
ncbi:GNAT family N-acetyltransferase [Ferrimonas balearica]|uniref:GNAT family N-acetyltransferase n=1 Tax=Ferrimonas balearica TaxID=44012 RepID=UPI001C9A2B5B|nr:GNAT family N-acetyltransferase [Ferrimonas balearica]MBY5923413.1 GNAT family N-acetyltransferase [Ferrimonas balearica]MBY5995163.1 GNAT family N-acetyltransferase [Ferrimonas balearica]